MTKTTNLTYDELLKLAKQRRVGTMFKIRVQPNQYGEGKEQLLIALIETNSSINAFNFNQDNINHFRLYNYKFALYNYKGTFDFLGFMVNENDLKYKKPEVLAIGTKVRINEEARKCGDYEGMIGKVFKISRLFDNYEGICYGLDISSWLFPHYCVEPVYDEPETVKELTMAELEEKLGHKVKIIK